MLKLNWMLCFLCFRFSFFSVVVPSRECFIACKCFSISSREFYWNVYLNLFTLTRAPLLTSLYSLYSDIIFFLEVLIVILIFLFMFCRCLWWEWRIKRNRLREREVTTHWIQADDTEKWNNYIKGNRINDDNLKWQLNAKKGFAL